MPDRVKINFRHVAAPTACSCYGEPNHQETRPTEQTGYNEPKYSSRPVDVRRPRLVHGKF